MRLNQNKTGIKAVFITVFMSLSLSLYANSPFVTKSYFEHLSEVNKEWSHHKDACPKGFVSLSSDRDKIQLHLDLVIEHLKVNIPSNLNDSQRSNRMFLLGKLQEYANHKVFPINKYHLVRQPYFVDDYGTNCAVGQMIDESGHQQLVAQISKEHNYDYIVDIHTEGLLEWAYEYGFTLDELKWIQPSYPPSTTIEQVQGGTNGTVNKIVTNNYSGGLIIAGNFTELDSLPCLNVGVYRNNQLTCLGNGVDGIINDVVQIGDEGAIYVFGELHSNGQQFPIAKYDGSNWSYLGIPTREGAVATTANYGGSGYQYEVAISHSSIPDHQEIWHFLTNNTWRKQAMVKGIVLDIIASGYGRVHVGHFDTVTVYDANAMIDTTLIVTNAVIHTNYSDVWYGIGNNLSDTVNVVIDMGNTLVFGGTCGKQPGKSNVCLSRYFNSVLQPLMLNNTEMEEMSVKAMTYGNGNTFTFGGYFDMSSFGLMTYGSHLATYNLVTNNYTPIAALDKGVNSIAFWGGELYIGGDFQSNLGDPNIHYLARTVSTVGINEPISDIELNVYPNPFQTTIHMDGIEDGVVYSLLYMDGRIAQSGVVQNGEIQGVNPLPKGTYILQLETTSGSIVKKISKL